MTLISNIKSYKQLLQKCPLIVCFLVVICSLISCGNSDDRKANLQNIHKNELKVANDKVALDSNNAQAWLERGKTYVQLKEYLSAIVSFDKAIERDSQFVDAWYNRGEVLAKINQPQEAIICFDKVVAIIPHHAGSWVARGDALRDLKMYEEAISSYDEGLRYQPDEYIIWMRRGHCALNVGRADSYAFKKSDELYNSEQKAYKWMFTGDSLKWEKHYDEALAAYDRALTIQTNHNEVFNQKGELLIYLNRYNEALVCFDSIIQAYENNKYWMYYFESSNFFWAYLCSAFENRGDLMINLNRKEDAISNYEKVLSIIPVGTSPDYTRPRIEEKLKNLSQGVQSDSQ